MTALRTHDGNGREAVGGAISISPSNGGGEVDPISNAFLYVREAPTRLPGYFAHSPHPPIVRLRARRAKHLRVPTGPSAGTRSHTGILDADLKV